MGFYYGLWGSFEFILVKCGCDVNIFHFYFILFITVHRTSFNQKGHIGKEFQ